MTLLYRALLTLLVCSALVACGDDAPADPAAPDTSGADAGESDVSEADAGTTDSGSADTGATDAGSTDTETDTETDTGADVEQDTETDTETDVEQDTETDIGADVEPTDEVCDNGEDDDLDGRTDCDDADCTDDAACAPAPDEVCDNGIDDDGDGAADCDDTDCARDFTCVAPVENCSNGVDDDGDGAADCADPDCLPFPVCRPTGEVCDNGEDDDADDLVDCADPDCTETLACFIAVEICTNGVDDDGDDAVDCDDADCATAGACTLTVEACGNGTDDDGDGDVDCEDVDCEGERVCSTPDAEACGNGLDDDEDGLADCEDGDCAADPTCAPPVEVCDNAVDDDGDEALDCADSDCAEDPACAAVVEVCDNELDDDGDGQPDCFDFECLGTDACPVEPVSGFYCPRTYTLSNCTRCASRFCCSTARDACDPILAEEFEASIGAAEGVTRPTAAEGFTYELGGATIPLGRPVFTGALFIGETKAVETEIAQQTTSPGGTGGGVPLPALTAPSFGIGTSTALLSRNARWESSPELSTCDEYIYQLFYTYERYRAAAVDRDVVEWAQWAADPANAAVGGLVAAFANGDDVRALDGRDPIFTGLPGGFAGNAFQSRLSGEFFDMRDNGAYRNEYHALLSSDLDMVEERNPALASRISRGRSTGLLGTSRNRIGNDESWSVLQSMVDTLLTEDANTALMAVHYRRRQRFREALDDRHELVRLLASAGSLVRPTLEARLDAIDNRIVGMLEWAGDNGCLAPVSSGGPIVPPANWAYNECDFSPMDVHDAIEATIAPVYAYERDRCANLPFDLSFLEAGYTYSFNRCNDRGVIENGGVFSETSLVSDGVLLLTIELYEAGSASVAECLEEVSAEQLASAANGPARNQPALQFGRGQSETWGKRKFVQAGYEWAVDVGLLDDGDDPEACLVTNPHAYGLFRVFGAVFNSGFDVVRIEGLASGAPANAFVDFEVLGTDYVELPWECGSASDRERCETSITLTRPFGESREFRAGESANFNILGVPVTVSAGVSAELGYEGSLGLEFGAGAVSGGCYGAEASAGGTFTPFADAGVFAEAGVGTASVSAGVRGHVTLIKLSVPVTADVAYEFALGGQRLLTMRSDAEVRLNSLSGYFELYARAFSLEASKRFFEWGGFSKTFELWDVGFEDVTESAWQSYFENR